MRVFISWSGSRSEHIAKSLRTWLPMVLQDVDPWMSQSDIDKGTAGVFEIAKQLKACDFGIFCLTPENRDVPWVNFEAGAISKDIDEARIWTYLYDMNFGDVSGPLARFQHTKVERAETHRLLESMNRKLAKPLPPDTFNAVFDALWPKFDDLLKSIPKVDPPKPSKPKPPEQIAEETLKAVRDLAQEVAGLRARVADMDYTSAFRVSVSDPVARYKILEDQLPSRQRDMLRLLRAGLGETEIANRYSVSPSTVRSFALQIFKHFNVSNRAEFLQVMGDLDDGSTST